jgi:hypothetical protein
MPNSPPPAPGARTVVVYQDAEHPRPAHDLATCEAIARLLAGLKGLVFAGAYDASGSKAPYFVPTDTIVGLAQARTLGIGGENDLFGGVVPHPFVATKCIGHALVDERARAPDGWSPAFVETIAPVVRRGYAAFAPDDARRAGDALLATGPVRIKRALGIGGTGQFVVGDRAALERALGEASEDEVARYGIALEEDLAPDVTTYSVGRVRVDDLVATYCGTQQTTRNGRGDCVYGGSQLLVARGEFEALLALGIPDDVARAVRKARAYDEAALRCFPGLFASRRNYDVAWGTNAAGEERSGVLEQSWRIGGASGAEVVALRAFRDDPGLRAVRAATVEVYGDASPPADAVVYYRGDDNHGGALTKYARIEQRVDA